MLHPLPEQDGIWQVSQRVVMGHIGDLGFGPPLLGNVEMRRYPPAAGHWLSRNADQTAIRELVDPARSGVGRQRIQSREQLLRSAIAGLALENAARNPLIDDF